MAVGLLLVIWAFLQVTQMLGRVVIWYFDHLPLLALFYLRIATTDDVEQL